MRKPSLEYDAHPQCPHCGSFNNLIGNVYEGDVIEREDGSWYFGRIHLYHCWDCFADFTGLVTTDPREDGE